MLEHETIAALRATAPSDNRPLPWQDDEGEVQDCDGYTIARAAKVERAHIVAAVNAAPHLLAEVDALRAQVAAAREVIDVLKWADHSILCAVTAVDRGTCDCGAAEANRRLAAAIAVLNAEVK